MRLSAVLGVAQALRMRRKLQPGSQRGRFRPTLTWRRPLSAVKCRPRPSRGRDAPPSTVGSGTWQVRVNKRPGLAESQELGGSGEGWGAAGSRGRLCGGGEGSGMGREPGLGGPRGAGGCEAARVGGAARRADAEGASGPAVPARERGSLPGVGDTPAGSISTPAARLSPSLDPPLPRAPRRVVVLRPQGDGVPGQLASAGRGRRAWACHNQEVLAEWEVHTNPCMRLFHSFLPCADGVLAPDRL